MDKSVYLPAGDTAGIGKLVQYMMRCPFSLGRMINISDDGNLIYRAEHKDCRKFPMPAGGDLKKGVARNFQVFDPLGFLAEVTQHFPEKGEHLVRCYGWYSNESRGLQNQSAADGQEELQIVIDDEEPPHRKTCRMHWAALIRRSSQMSKMQRGDKGCQLYRETSNRRHRKEPSAVRIMGGSP